MNTPSPIFAAISGIFLVAVFWPRKKFIAIGACLIFLALGVWRCNTALSSIPQIKAKDVNFNAVVVEDPDVRETSVKLILRGVGDPLIKGKILVTTSRYPEYRYGNKLKIIGKLEPPPIFDEFNYRDYLKKDGIFAVMSWPKIEVLGNSAGNPVISTLFSFKNKFKTATSRFLSLPQQGFLEALVFGEENNISANWKEKLNLTGTRHIAAVSGMNITIIAAIIINFFL
ncbi:MAG: ComEC/Rec2 family competence protein, partial [Candidatus Nealsonbacteria bacterium]